MASRPAYLTKAISEIKDIKAREVVRVCDMYITDQATFELCACINGLQDRVKELEKVINAHGIRI